MSVAVRPLLFKPHRLNGLSDKLLISHYEPAALVFEINGMKREELIAAGSVIHGSVLYPAIV